MENIDFTPRRVAFLVTIDLDPIPGAFHDEEDAREKIETMLKNNVGHYDPRIYTLQASQL